MSGGMIPREDSACHLTIIRGQSKEHTNIASSDERHLLAIGPTDSSRCSFVAARLRAHVGDQNRGLLSLPPGMPARNKRVQKLLMGRRRLTGGSLSWGRAISVSDHWMPRVLNNPGLPEATAVRSDGRLGILVWSYAEAVLAADFHRLGGARSRRREVLVRRLRWSRIRSIAVAFGLALDSMVTQPG